MRASLFVTCLGDQFFAQAAADAVRLLRHLGVEVDFPEAQTCCGQPAYNSGHAGEARRMARHTLSVFADAQYVVAPSGSCAAMLRSGYERLLDGADQERARRLGSRTYELAQFVVDVLEVRELGRGLEGRRVAYHHGCHALRELEVREQPLALLRGAGAVITTWPAAEECCGFGGLFSVKHSAVSVAMADRKLDTLDRGTGLDCVTSADGGCLLQLSSRARSRGDDVPFRHLAQLLWEAVGGAT